MSDSRSEVIPLPEQFVQTQLGALKDQVDGHRKEGFLVRFDAGAVKRIDGAAVQFLLAAVRLQEAALQDPLVLNANDIVVNAIRDMGLNTRVSVCTSQSADAA